MLDKLFKEKIITIGGKGYKLKRVTTKELFKYRLGNKPGLVFKSDTDLWYTELPKDSIRFNKKERASFSHLCSSESECCERLSAAPDPIGCACMRDVSFGSCRTMKNRVFLCNTSMRIEKYPFIEFAIESFNMKEDAFKVLSCKDCVRSRKKPKKMNFEEQKRRILGLAQNLNPDLEDLEQMNRFPKLKD